MMSAPIQSNAPILFNASTMRWIGLGGISALSLILTGQDGLQGPLFALAVCLAAVVSGVAGFAFSAICGAVLFHLSDDPVKVVQIMMTCSIANQGAMTWALRREIDWRGLCLTLAGGTIGLPAGVWILLHIDHRHYVEALGGFLLVYGTYMLARKPMIIRTDHAALDFAAGVLSGIVGGAAAFPGAILTIWCGLKGWNKSRQRAMSQPFILIMQIAALAVITLSRGTAAQPVGFDEANLLFIPVSLLGTAVGLMLYRRLSDRQFAGAVNIMLVISGLSYIL
jgi:uncharacterized membrane protein YfcA